VENRTDESLMIVEIFEKGWRILTSKDVSRRSSSSLAPKKKSEAEVGKLEAKRAETKISEDLKCA
jgi:hypothetical protein